MDISSKLAEIIDRYDSPPTLIVSPDVMKILRIESAKSSWEHFMPSPATEFPNGILSKFCGINVIVSNALPPNEIIIRGAQETFGTNNWSRFSLEVPVIREEKKKRRRLFRLKDEVSLTPEFLGREQSSVVSRAPETFGTDLKEELKTLWESYKEGNSTFTAEQSILQGVNPLAEFIVINDLASFTEPERVNAGQEISGFGVSGHAGSPGSAGFVGVSGHQEVSSFVPGLSGFGVSGFSGYREVRPVSPSEEKFPFCRKKK